MTSPLPFPAITVCNLNPLDLSKLSVERGKALDLAMSDAVYSLMAQSKPSNDTGTDGVDPDLMSAALTIADMSVADLMFASDIDTSEFFTSCQFGSKLMDCSKLFTPFQLMFDSVLPPATRRTSLKLTVYVNHAGYSSQVNELGAKFHVHAPGDTPDMMTSRHVAPTGFSTSVALRMFEHEYLPPPHQAFGDSSCTDTDSAEFRRLMDGDPPLYEGSQGGQYSLDACLAHRGFVQVAD
ncbi:hypothetical protein BaRGS_00008188, partial [Batillaria attramentaria]